MVDVTTWRPHPAYIGYEASSAGQVRSVDRRVTDISGRCTRTFRGRVLKPTPNPDGRLAVSISQTGAPFSVQVHILVCESFHGLKPSPDLEVRHLNGDPRDNRPENLRWGTKSENAKDCFAHGTNRNLNLTHCKRGHEFTPENTYVRRPTRADLNPGRNCRACKNQKQRQEYRDKVLAEGRGKRIRQRADVS